MSFDLGDLIQALRADPAQRDVLRRELLGDQPDLHDSLSRLANAQERTEARLEGLARAQERTEEALKGLVDVVTGMNDRLARIDGESLERRYRERGHAYFMRIARRLHPLDPGALSALVDDARRDGRLSELEVESLLQTDAVFAGHSRDSEAPVHLVVEASVTIGHHNVRRARERADLLARVVDTPVIPVVAGQFAPEPVALAAQDAGVWRVTDGRG